MATEPKIIVKEEAVSIPQNAEGNILKQDSIAIIGAFDSEITALTTCTTAREAHQKFGTMATEGDFKGTDAIDGLFFGASNLLVANITTWSESTASTTVTTEKLEAALALLHNERFDILYIADQLSDAHQTIVSAWLDAEFEAKYPHGQIAQLQQSSAAAYGTSVNKFNNNVYYINTQQFTVNGETLSLNRSTAFIAGYIASLDIDESLTAQIIPGITGVTPEYSTAVGEMGATLLGLNVPFLKPFNRMSKTYYCVNSELPDELDLYINRTRDSILNNLAVETYLGKKNNTETEEGIITVIEGLKQDYIKNLQLIEGLTYHVNKTSSKCVDVVIDKMVFADIITTINVTYSVEVQ